MQTFLPCGPSFHTGFSKLDYRRLGKQRVEAYQILLCLLRIDKHGQPRDPKGWVNHPAVKMWAGHEDALLFYGMEACREWRSRGYNDTLLSKFHFLMWNYVGTLKDMPPWLFGETGTAIIRSHRSNLVRKDPEYYGKLFPEVPADLPYVWPV
jgi:hypothetical protein